MPLVTTEATVLKTYEYSETSKILRLLTRDLGLCSVIAKGARRPKSRFGGLLEPFTDGEATFYAKEGRELHTLSGFELHRERQALGRELVRYAGAGLLSEIVLRFAPAAADDELFFQLRRGLDHLVEENGDLEIVILQQAWQLIERLGFAPSIDRCTLCGAGIVGDEDCFFDLGGGGAICARCRTRTSGLSLRPLKPRARAELIGLLSPRPPLPAARRLETAPAQRDLLRDFIAYHLADHRPLNSFRFLEERLR
ncbi:MAG: DNA repair protein RecO [Gemmatimonadota bacterium]|nr:MAG: DNA repair protein RecO [Gemmatimonadota bacterium]